MIYNGSESPPEIEMEPNVGLASMSEITLKTLCFKIFLVSQEVAEIVLGSLLHPLSSFSQYFYLIYQ
jgi:hypothetical protein